jgi:Tyrosyl-DNA phosphodiesterase
MTPKLNCRNWECGVVLPIRAHKSDRVEAAGEGPNSNDLGLFKDVVPIPMMVPGQPYQGNRKPWFYSEQ